MAMAHVDPVIAPMVMGLGATYLLLPGSAAIPVALFMGACLCATSVGLSARVLAERSAGISPGGCAIFGAAAIDD